MPVIVSRTGTEVPQNRYAFWTAIAGAPADLPESRRLDGVGQALETAFDDNAEAYVALGRELGGAPSGGLAHAPACAVNPSDMAQMLAWSRVVRDWGESPETILLICDDPWMCRAFLRHPGVSASGALPRVWPRELVFLVRGFLSRGVYALRAAAAAVTLRSHRTRATPGESVILVYNHPRSTLAGDDGFFGDLMQRMPALRRMLHVDCPPARARELAADGRSLSLHAWGNPFYPLCLPFVRWRPGWRHLDAALGWIVRRAQAIEGSGGTAAAIAWQRHCQRRWLRAARPGAVSWPWENHNWERAFVRAARQAGVRTAGYQHSVIGRQMLNHAVGGNPDGLDSIPEHVICNGTPTRDQLISWGLPEDRTVIGGALRYPAPASVPFDPAAPVFMALPFDGPTAAQMVAAAKADETAGRRYVVKDHPIYRFAFDESARVKPTSAPLTQQPAVSAVIYAATTVGLEALLIGLPTLRFRPADRVAIDILPDGLSVPVADPENMAQNVSALRAVTAPEHDRIFAPVEMTVWEMIFGEGGRQNVS